MIIRIGPPCSTGSGSPSTGTDDNILGSGATSRMLVHEWCDDCYGLRGPGLRLADVLEHRAVVSCADSTFMWVRSPCVRTFARG